MGKKLRIYMTRKKEEKEKRRKEEKKKRKKERKCCLVLIKRPEHHVGAMHCFETYLKMQLFDCSLLVSITRNEQTDTLLPFRQSGSHVALSCSVFNYNGA